MTKAWGDLISTVYKAHTARPVPLRLMWQGLELNIENPRGTSRSGVDRDGSKWETHMLHHYGEVAAPEGGREATSVDGDPLDCYVNPEGLEADSGTVWVIYIVHPDSGEPDEPKAYLAFTSEQEVLESFNAHYQDAGRFFGCIHAMPTQTFVAWCRGATGQQLVPHMEARIKLHQRQVSKAVALIEEHREWMRGVVEVEKAAKVEEELTDEEAITELQFAQDVDLDELRKTFGAELIDRAIAHLKQSGQIGKSVSMDVEIQANVSKAASVEDAETRVIRVWPGFTAVDIQGDIIPPEEIRKSWSYYEKAGNGDLEHLTKKGGKTYQEYVAKVVAEGFPAPGPLGRTHYEVGRPVPGSFRDSDDSFLMKVYKGNPVADAFWDSVMRGENWKPSVGGSMVFTNVIVENNDPVMRRKGKQLVRVAKSFSWNNVGFTREPVNQYVREIEVVGESELRAVGVLKGVSMSETTINTISAREVLKGIMLVSAQNAIDDMLHSGQIGTNEVISMTADVTKALGIIEDDGEVQVSKALDYGLVTSDASKLTQAGAASSESLSPYKKHKKVRELLKDTIDGISPISKALGYEPPADAQDYLCDIGDVFMQEFGMNEHDAIDCAEQFIRLALEG